MILPSKQNNPAYGTWIQDTNADLYYDVHTRYIAGGGDDGTKNRWCGEYNECICGSKKVLWYRIKKNKNKRAFCDDCIKPFADDYVLCDARFEKKITVLPPSVQKQIKIGLDKLEDEYGTGIQSDEFGSEGQYGPVHDWQADPAGASVAAAANPSGRSDLQSWLDDRRAAFDALVETYSGEELARRETESAAQTLEQPACHGTPHPFDKFSLEHNKTGEGANAFG